MNTKRRFKCLGETLEQVKVYGYYKDWCAFHEAGDNIVLRSFKEVNAKFQYLFPISE